MLIVIKERQSNTQHNNTIISIARGDYPLSVQLSFKATKRTKGDECSDITARLCLRARGKYGQGDSNEANMALRVRILFIIAFSFLPFTFAIL